MLKKFLLTLLLFGTLLNATAPTKVTVTRLYIATLDRAPDSKGLTYWIESSHLDLEKIAMSFFDQPELDAKYPKGTTYREFIKSIYNNLFKRVPDDAGWDYWEAELENNSIPRSLFILAIINGALGDDAKILANRATVGLSYANANKNDIPLAINILKGVTANIDSISTALCLYKIVECVDKKPKVKVEVVEEEDKEETTTNDDSSSTESGSSGGSTSTGGSTSSSGSTSGGTTPPSTTKVKSAKIISVSSASNDSAYVEWLPSESEQSMELSYEVHISTQKDFVPSSSTKVLETKDKEALIENLDASTKYYTMIVTKSSNDTAESMQLDVRTSSVKARVATGNNLLIQENSEILSKDDTSVTTSSPMSVGDYIVGNSQNIYLRKVTGVEQTANGYVAQTENSTLGKVFSDLEFSTSYRIEDVANSSQSSTRSRTKSYQTSSYKWKSGSSLSYSTKASSRQTRTIVKHSTLKDDIGEYYSLKVPKSISVNLGDKLKHKIDLSKIKDELYSYADGGILDEKNECSKADGTYNEDYFVNRCENITPKICSLKYSVDSVDDVGDNNKPYITNDENGYYINWTPTRDNIVKSDGGYYLMDIDVKIGAGDCKGDNDDLVESLDIDNIKLIAGDDIGVSLQLATDIKPFKFATDDGNIVFENKLNANFTPYLGFSGKFVDDDLDYATAKLITTFEVSNIAELVMKLEKSHTFAPIPIYTKDFIKIVMAGPVPIIITGHIRFMMVAEVEANAQIVSTLDMGSTFKLDYGIEYKNGKWRVVGNKSFEYHIKAEAEGDAEATVTIKLIPDLSLTLYELAAVHVVVEPYLYGTVGVNGKVTAQYGNNSYTDTNARFTKIEAGIGVDLKAYAGAAWDTRFKSLKFPSNATYADINKNDFYNNKAKRVEYYEAIGEYEPFTIMDKTTLADIPTLTKEDPIYDEIPPSGVNTRAIKVQVGYKNIPNPFYNENKEGSKESYLPFEKWFDLKSVTENSIIKTTDTEGEYWVIPQLNSDGSQSNTTARFFAHSSLGSWAVQSIDVEIDAISSGQDAIPTYWSSRYIEEGALLDPSEDNDNDGYTNFQEYQNGTNPLVKDNQKLSVLLEDDKTFQFAEEKFITPTIENNNDNLNITYSWIENGEELCNQDSLPTNILSLGTHNITLNIEDTEDNIATDDTVVTITDTTPSTATFSLGGDKTKEEQKTIVIPFNKQDDNNQIDSIECNTNPTDVVVSNTTVKAVIEIPTFDDIQEFDLTCVAYDVDSVELHSEAITITVSQKTQPTSTGLGVIKKTGQTESYTDYDDGDYQKGVTPNYTREGEIVTDHITKLMWQDDAEAKTVQKQWLTDDNYDDCSDNGNNCENTSGDTATTYCSNLDLGGYDWRLPTSKELESIVDYGKYDPAINATFDNISSYYFWSSTIFKSNSNGAWIVNFRNGYVSYRTKNANIFVLCVRAGE